jgi:hypothetical protein
MKTDHQHKYEFTMHMQILSLSLSHTHTYYKHTSILRTCTMSTSGVHLASAVYGAKLHGIIPQRVYPRLAARSVPRNQFRVLRTRLTRVAEGACPAPAMAL